MMPPTFAATFCALLLLGSDAALLVAAIGAATPRWKRVGRRYWSPRILGNVTIALIATEIAGLVYTSLGGEVAAFNSPWQALPIAGAAIGYYLLESGLANVVVALVRTRSVNRTWSKWAIQGCSTFLVGAGLAAAAAEAINHGSWGLLVVAIMPVTFAYRMYADYVAGLDQEDRDRKVVAIRTEGVCVVDRDTRITFWDPSLEWLLECPRERALGRDGRRRDQCLEKNRPPRSHEGNTDGSHVTHNFGAPGVCDTRSGAVRSDPLERRRVVVAVAGRHRAHACRAGAQAQRRAAGARGGRRERRAVGVGSARTQEFYFSGRWRAMIGLPRALRAAVADEWLERVHADDIADSEEALEAHLAGTTEVFQHEHRIRHEDGTYRRFLCRGVAVRGAGGRAAASPDR